MKKICLTVLLLTSLSFTLLAQNPLDVVKNAAPAATPQAPAGVGSILSDLGNGIKPESFTPKFKPAEWLNSVSSLKATDLSGASKLLGQLGGGLKTTSLTKGFSLKNWQSKLQTVKSMGAFSSQAETLVKNISPSAFKSGFDVNTILSSLKSLKGLK